MDSCFFREQRGTLSVVAVAGWWLAGQPLLLLLLAAAAALHTTYYFLLLPWFTTTTRHHKHSLHKSASASGKAHPACTCPRAAYARGEACVCGTTRGGGHISAAQLVASGATARDRAEECNVTTMVRVVEIADSAVAHLMRIL